MKFTSCEKISDINARWYGQAIRHKDKAMTERQTGTQREKNDDPQFSISGNKKNN